MGCMIFRHTLSDIFEKVDLKVSLKILSHVSSFRSVSQKMFYYYVYVYLWYYLLGKSEVKEYKKLTIVFSNLDMVGLSTETEKEICRFTQNQTLGRFGNRTRDHSHPKGVSYP